MATVGVKGLTDMQYIPSAQADLIKIPERDRQTNRRIDRQNRTDTLRQLMTALCMGKTLPERERKRERPE